VFDVQGRQVVRLLDQQQPAGRHEVLWDGQVVQGGASTGVYFVRMDVGRRSTTRRLIMFR
jgi:hypothetical protein